MYDYSDLLNPANPLSPFNPSNPANPIYQDLYGDDTDLEEYKNQVEENGGQTHQGIKMDHALTNFSVVVLKSMMGIMFLLFASIIIFVLIKWIRRRS
ncbi:hypothetical protein JJB71_16600 [Clostridium perfringens]|uniref:hypothetical protein n=1 Tax=Clostridium perfringens TaxID=1502 RepID=UPI001ABB5C21|nr:hypothetical protein [Clostridium perfringens]MBO3399135.1 hypothetical protein [Clostridium perfringens]